MREHKRKGWIDQLSWGLGRVAMLIPGVIVAIMMYEVLMRYVIEKPTIWVNEMSLWMAGWVYLFAGLYAMQQRGHIRITLLYDACPLWLRRVFDSISTLFIVLWTLATLYGGFNEAWKGLISWELMDSAWAPPIPATTQPLILLVMVLMSLQAVSNLIMDWQNPHSEDEDELDAEIEEIKRSI